MPLVNGLTEVVVGDNIYLGVRMSDDSVRICSYDGRYPVGSQVGTDFTYPINASFGIYEQQPANVPMSFIDYIQALPAGYESINLEARFINYDWDEQEQEATWSAKLYCENVVVYPTSVIAGDTDLTIIHV